MDARPSRIVVVSTVLLLLCIGEASAAVVDATLVVRGVHRPPGRQSAIIRLTVTPPPATRTRSAATLTVGTAVFPLEVATGRTGRASARAFRLTVPALPDFGVAALDLPPPIDATVEFAAGDCIARSRGNVLECPAGTAPSEPAPDGVYDADVARVDGNVHLPIAPALASVTTGSDGSRGLRILLTPYDGISLSGPPDGSTAALTGYAVTGGDIISTASGGATASHGTTGSRFEGSATSAPFGPPSTWSFVLTRPDSGTPAELGGTWVVSFTGSGLMPFNGAVTLAVTVPPDGHATTAPTMTSTGPPYAIDAGTCLVAPGGALSCWLPAVQLYGIQMQGALDVASGTGSGRFYVGAPPLISSDGTWTAVRP